MHGYISVIDNRYKLAIASRSMPAVVSAIANGRRNKSIRFHTMRSITW